MHNNKLNVAVILVAAVLFSTIAGCATTNESTISRNGGMQDATLTRSQKMLQLAID